ncbi:GIY-YIG nuclease family protein [Roseivirga spongicola]|uniref:GIY-YIG nuclease family protein n=1 Tax=Roseivirga spongicola TaxID=333140 RepID=UPI001AFEC1C2|nr:GIY-YIG nuclease family protein [Roseivirga sp.]MBO6910042.1 GIY-YIG nuclease family protein [Roseivirga sp.]
MHTLYILYSKGLDRYYVGETEDFNVRLEQHNAGYFKKSSTSNASDWEEYLTAFCQDRSHARRVEMFIKRQKSRVFIESLRGDSQKLSSIIERFM